MRTDERSHVEARMQSNRVAVQAFDLGHEKDWLPCLNTSQF